jgi:7-cyano-7-deazaguanine synthase in queuosine biosynthesis
MNNTLVHNYHNKNVIDYRFEFNPISNNNGLISFIDNSQNQEQLIGFNINDKEFGYRVEKEFPSLMADLIDLAVAIYACDRLIPLNRHNLNKIQRRLLVTLPVRHPELFNSDSFQQKLNDLLIWTTGNQWIFEFKKRQISGRFVEQQPLLLPTITENSEVALWSGGLDSLAGLYTRLKANPDKSFTLFGSGSNKIVFHYQKKLAQQIDSIFPKRIHLLQVPIHFNKSGDIPKNKLSRARGILFTLLGSVCAYLMGQRQLFIYENGVGAINLPYSKATVGLDHSRSVNPLTLLMVSDLVSELIGERFEIKNPFLFLTKAQMCEALAKDHKDDLSSLAVSCDSRYRKKDCFQCGYCSSCLLRRQAIIVSNLEDKTPYVINSQEYQSKTEDQRYFNAMKTQVNTIDFLLKKSPEKVLQWKYLSQEFLELDDIVDRTYEFEKLSLDDMQNRLIQLYETYVSEWKRAESILEKGFLTPTLTDQKN